MLCESQGGRPGPPIPNCPYSLCGHKATLNRTVTNKAQVLCESQGGRPGPPIPNCPYSLCGRKATLNRTELELVTKVNSQYFVCLSSFRCRVCALPDGCQSLSNCGPRLPHAAPGHVPDECCSCGACEAGDLPQRRLLETAVYAREGDRDMLEKEIETC